MDPITPQEAFQMYISERRGEVTGSTLQSHQYRLEHFMGWLSDHGIDNLNELSGRELHEYRIWREDDGDLAPASLKTQMDTLRVFVKFCERIEAVQPELHKKVKSPSLAHGENERDVMLGEDRAERIMDYLRKYRYATRTHVVMQLAWKAAFRTGTIHALDLGDYEPQKSRVKLHHRPETGTTLKNGERAERYVALRPETAEVLDDYVSSQRLEQTDDNGRVPLLTTSRGRVSRNSIRETIYRITRPCEYDAPCPHDRDPETCEATDDANKQASKCPSSVSGHPVRRGSITAHLLDDVPKTIVSDRCDVTSEVLDKHYDRRTEQEKAEQRRDYL